MTWTAAARAKTTALILSTCSECPAEIWIMARRKDLRNLCPACKKAASIQHGRDYRRKYPERCRERDLKRRPRSDSQADYKNKPAMEQHNYQDPLTLVSVPDDSWPAGGRLARCTWEEMAADKNYALDGARWVDKAGGIWTAAGGQIVRDLQ